MPIYQTLKDGESFLEELPISRSLAVGASAEQQFFENPLTASVRSIDQAGKEYGDIHSQIFLPGGTGVYSDERPLIPFYEAVQKAKELDVKIDIPKEGITQGQFDYLVNIKKTEDRYNSIIARAPSDITTTLSMGATRLAVGSLDPLNIGSALIPIVGEARYTAMIANAVKPLSRAAVRAKVGLAEGIVGAATLEPLNYTLAQYEQRDYTLTESLENLVFGGILGAGLHSGIGALADAFALHKTTKLAEPLPGNGEVLSRIDPRLKDTASRIAIGQVLGGYYPNVESILSLDPNYQLLNQRLRETTKKVDPFAPKPPYDPLAPNVVILNKYNPEMATQTISVKTPNAQTFAPSLTGTNEFRTFNTKKEAENIVDTVYRRSGEVLAIKQNNDGQFILLREFNDKPIRNENGSILGFNTERAAVKATNTITSLKGKDLTPVPFMQDGEVKYALVENANQDFVTAAKSNPEFVQFELNKQNTQQALPIREPSVENLARIQQAAQQQVQISQMRLADPEAMRVANEIYANVQKMEDRPVDIATAEQEATYYQDLVTQNAKAMGVESDLAELKQYDDLVKDTDNFAKAIESAFNCSIRKGL